MLNKAILTWVRGWLFLRLTTDMQTTYRAELSWGSVCYARYKVVKLTFDSGMKSWGLAAIQKQYFIVVLIA